MKNTSPADLQELSIPIEDLKRCHDLLGIESWKVLTGQHIFITGATGFIGKWLLATLLDARKRLNIDCKITALSRNPDHFIQQWPHLNNQIEWIKGDVKNFTIPNKKIDCIIHAATDVCGDASPDEIFATCHDGTRQIISLANKCNARTLLLISSGAIYGPFPNGVTQVTESHIGGPDPLLASSAYAEGKRVSEWLSIQAASDLFEVKIARVFSLVGPHLPLDKHFAIGNFIRSVLDNQEIIIKGDGSAYRSYLYAADMSAWLWAILLRGKSGKAYNVGSDKAISIEELAKTVGYVCKKNIPIKILNQSSTIKKPTYYVPDIMRIQKELNLRSPMSLEDAIIRTVKWYLNEEINHTNHNTN
ncbi:NAD-dependent epimerase/dehydratase family protein [Aquitalea denitrificans]|uniref:NAD-dependent epimerase/dehydratase family protein n=1 Tax=Aquitalea denitrificans TaxID=519081 RepID=UPI001358B1C7|nr:NAD(P)-dependent oxidoreductase [Aquitalea denitrificans]